MWDWASMGGFPPSGNPVSQDLAQRPYEANLMAMSPSGHQPSENKPKGFVCSTCGQWHAGLPLDWGFSAPIYWYQISEKERSSKDHLSGDFCVIGGKDFFVRGVIEIPIVGSEEVFKWGVWVTLSQPHFDRMTELWNDSRIVEEPRYFGWLSNKIPIYADTLNLKTHIYSKDVKHRPSIELETTDHPLAVEQSSGITYERVEEIAAQMTHASSKS
jgi:hypothetical protein